MTVTLDTNAYSDWRKAGKWRETLAWADKIYLPSIVIGELNFCFRNGSRYQENWRKLEDFLNQVQVEEWRVGSREARIYGGLVLDLRRCGNPMPLNDVWIAACSEAGGSDLLTSDHHFKSLPQLKVSWPQAEMGFHEE